MNDVARKIDPEHLVGATEAAKRLGVGRQTVTQWARRHKDHFPAPVVVIERTMVWEWAAIEEWARATGRLP